MKNKFSPALLALRENANRFDAASSALVKSLLSQLAAMPLPATKELVDYHDYLLFISAYPGNAAILKMANAELKRMTVFLQKQRTKKHTIPYNEGLPFTNIITRFSPDFLKWLVVHPDIKVGFDSFYDPTLKLNDVLNITLPSLLKAETTAGLSNEDLLELLHIHPDQYAPFLLSQFEQLHAQPLLKDLFMERLDMYVKLIPRNKNFSKAYNCLPVKNIYYHTDLLKNFDSHALLHTALPPVQTPAKAEREALLKLVRNSMALTVREIDPASFMEPDTIRTWQLERGISIAVYSMIPQRQLPLETYFGFTFLKNGVPISYGGVWAFGKLARLGLNIFEPYRGGESGYLLCQLMRVFKQGFGVSYFEIEPYQFGLDNPGGISSGAFWFYHKYGFRPVDKTLQQLATAEYKKIKSRKGYRSSEKTLLRFTEGNIFLNLEKKTPLDVLGITPKVLSLIKNNWKHNYAAAKQKAMDDFCAAAQLDQHILDTNEKQVLEETALWAAAMKVKKPQQLELMKQMVITKTKDDYAYQALLLRFFA